VDKRSDKSPEDGPGLSEEQIFTLLSMQRRRELLRALDRWGGEATVGDLTNELASGEHGGTADGQERKTVYVSLYQTHIPRLVEAGVLEYDPRSKTVRLTGRGELLLAYLRFDPTAKRPGLFSRMFRPDGRERAK
jgi:hypothetical protein